LTPKTGVEEIFNMRTLFLIFVTVFASAAAAQSPQTISTFDEGERLARSADFDKASADFRRAVMTAEADGAGSAFLARLHFNLGVCEYRLGRYPRAVSEFKLASALAGGTYQRASYGQGMAELAQNNFKNARRAFLQGLRVGRKDGEAWFDLAFAYLGERDLSSAESAFRRSILYKSIDADLAHNNLGVVLALRGDIAAAVREFETALALSGGHLAEARANIEYCRSLAGNAAMLVAKLEFGTRGTGRHSIDVKGDSNE
jgi:Flp pilus assembly protein TadD